MKYVIAIFCIVVMITISGSSQTLENYDCKQFLGKWELKPKEGVIIEEWRESTPSIYFGSSYEIKGSDTIHLETIRLVIIDGGPVYIPAVNNQNEEKEVLFYFKKGTSHVKNSNIVFENAKHDYPQRIIYQFKEDGTLLARIEGMVKGKLKYSEFNYKKIE